MFVTTGMIPTNTLSSCSSCFSSPGSAHLTCELCTFQLRLRPILDGQAVLYSFYDVPDVRVGVAFGSGSQSAPQTELPVVSSWLVCTSCCLHYYKSDLQ